MKRTKNNSHLTLEARIFIENKLNEGASITEIASSLCRHKSTILREIQRHSTYFFPSIFNSSHPCMKHDTCYVKDFDCYKVCKNIEIKLCPSLTSSPHVCNNCNHKSGCRYVKRYYKAYEANSEYLNSWKEVRIGLRYTEAESKVLNTDFYNLVIMNKSIYHSLLIINRRGYNFNESSIYRQIKKGYLKLKHNQLPRNRKEKDNQIDREYKNEDSIEGHTYEDFEKYKKDNPEAIETQMDTVIGITGANEPVILTLEIVEISFMFIFKISKKTFDKTLEKLKQFENTITTKTFNKILEILLTDNGSEFKSLSKLIQAFPNINIFYCHPYSSYEKGSIENNHELIRRVIPKSVSLKPYTQADYNKLASHINSLYRKKLNGKCPFELIEKYIPIEVINKLGLRRIQDDKVTLTPLLLGEKNIENIRKHLSYEEIKKANISITFNNKN